MLGERDKDVEEEDEEEGRKRARMCGGWRRVDVGAATATVTGLGWAGGH